MMVRIGIAQMHPQVGEMKKNLKHLDEILHEASSKDIQVLVLPELANSGYAFESKDEASQCAEEIPGGPYSQKLMEWSTDHRLVVAGICEDFDSKLYNSAGVFANGKHIGTYRKIHLFNKEKKWFNAGEEEPLVVLHEGHRYGVMVCWDWAFPEVARILALKGAQVILHPANLVLTYCQDAMRTRSIENGVFTATANRIGLERKLAFSGKSQVTNNRSKILLTLPEDKVMVDSVEIQLGEADEKHLTKRNHLIKDRRPELYMKLIESS
ncbi:MAG: nitrilase-related carbon-nitrogen hydrolase [Candidatus Thorarchaeota archaeon]